MSWALYTILAVPLVAVALTLLDGWRLARAATLVAGLVSLALAIAIAITVEHGRVLHAADGWLRVDSLGAVFLLATGLLYAMAGVFSIGYLGVEEDRAGLPAVRQALLRAAEPVRLERCCWCRSRRTSGRCGSRSS